MEPRHQHYTPFADLIRAKRKSRHLRQADVAAAIGLGRKRYEQLEYGQYRRAPTPAQLRALGAVLQVPVPQLLAALGYDMEDVA